MSQFGEVFTLAVENPPVPGCTVSMRVTDEIYHFSLAANTDISAEIYPYPKLLIMAEGGMEVYTASGDTWTVLPGNGLVTPCDIPVGMRSQTGALYLSCKG